MKINYRTELELMRMNFKKQKVNPLKLTKPEWVKDDPLNKVYTNMDFLLQEGEVYWGSLVQANEILFKKKPYLDCPGNVLFSTNYLLNSNPEMMSLISQEIFSYKNTNEAPAYLKRVVEIVTDEMERVFNHPISLNEIELLSELPVTFQDDTVLFTTMMFFRDYMPKGRLCSGIFPIVAAPQVTDISIMLPKKYWTKETVKMFVGN